MARQQAHHFPNTHRTPSYITRPDLDPRAGRWTVVCNDKGVPSEITLNCPCGCGVTKTLPLQPTNEAPSWLLRGPRFAPTLYPAVTFGAEHDNKFSHWTGWLIEGEWKDTRPRPALRVANE